VYHLLLHCFLSVHDVIRMDMFRLQSNNDPSSSDVMDKAKHIWSMLDELASSDPKGYK
jgi:hypothetical protein